jgi:Phospholipase B
MRLNNVSDTGNYCDAISCRCDLQPHGPGVIGAIDCKATSGNMIGNLEAYIIAGPTTEMTPAFDWNNWPKYINYSNGMPRSYNYTWQDIVPYF